VITIGIDQSYSALAVVLLDTWQPARPNAEVGAFPSHKHGTGVDRLLRVEEWLVSLLTSWTSANAGPPAHVAMEGYSRGSRQRREEAGELGGTIKRVLRAVYPAPVCYPTVVPPSSLKLFATGSGRATKHQVIDAVFDTWSYKARTDDIADAYTLAVIAARTASLATIPGAVRVLPDHQARVLSSLTPHTEQPQRNSQAA